MSNSITIGALTLTGIGGHESRVVCVNVTGDDCMNNDDFREFMLSKAEWQSLAAAASSIERLEKENDRLQKDAQSARLDLVSSIGQDAETEADLRAQLAQVRTNLDTLTVVHDMAFENANDANDAELAAFLCVECGPAPRIDEDGCCASCGGAAMGTWLDKAVKVGNAIATLVASVTKLRHERADLTAQSESWRLSCLAWQSWAEGLVEQPEGGTLGAEEARERIAARLSALGGARAAARALIGHVDNLGAFADDNDPRVMSIAEPLSAAQADLWHALGLDHDAEVARLRADIDSRCAVCGWTLAPSIDKGCVRGNCSYRPRPKQLYAPERAARESAHDCDNEDCQRCFHLGPLETQRKAGQ